jgi:hypothetical protein
MIEDYCIAQFQKGFVTSSVLETLSTLCLNFPERTVWFDTVRTWLQNANGPAAIELVELIAIHGVLNDRAGREAARLIPSSPYFFGLFNAIVAAEKMNRAIMHCEVSEKYTGVFRRALEFLEHPKLRIFSPILAMFPEDVPMPPVFDAFLAENAGKIQRMHQTESAHEW